MHKKYELSRLQHEAERMTRMKEKDGKNLESLALVTRQMTALRRWMNTWNSEPKP